MSDPKLATWLNPILNVVVPGAKASEPIQSCALRDNVLAKGAVNEAVRFSCFQSTFEVVEHKGQNIGF